MKEILVWMLVSIPDGVTGYAAQKHAHVIERFVTVAECQRVANVLSDTKPGGRFLNLRCVQARVVVVE